MDDSRPDSYTEAHGERADIADEARQAGRSEEVVGAMAPWAMSWADRSRSSSLASPHGVCEGVDFRIPKRAIGLGGDLYPAPGGGPALLRPTSGFLVVDFRAIRAGSGLCSRSGGAPR